jgi:hypothetical protein
VTASCVIHLGHELVRLLGRTAEGQKQRGRCFAHRTISSSRGQGHAVTHYQSAVTGWRSFANPFELAHALAGHARSLAALDRAGEAELAADEAASTFKRLGVRGSALPPLPNRALSSPLRIPSASGIRLVATTAYSEELAR